MGKGARTSFKGIWYSFILANLTVPTKVFVKNKNIQFTGWLFTLDFPLAIDCLDSYALLDGQSRSLPVRNPTTPVFGVEHYIQLASKRKRFEESPSYVSPTSPALTNYDTNIPLAQKVTKPKKITAKEKRVTRGSNSGIDSELMDNNVNELEE